MGARKILNDVSDAYKSSLAKSEAQYREKQGKFLEAERQRGLQMRNAEDHEGRKRGEPPLDPKYIEYGPNAGLVESLRKMDNKSRGTSSSSVRRVIP